MKKFKIKNKNECSKIVKTGDVDLLDCILPDVIDFREPKYIQMDGYFYSGIIVTNYSRKQGIGWLSALFELDFNADISMFYEKLDTVKVVREITYQIGNMSGEMRTVGDNRQDIDVIKGSCEDAKYIRQQMQVNKEDLYYLCIYISVYSGNKEELNRDIERLEGSCASIGLQTRRAVFRQEQIFYSMLPICENLNDIKESSARNVLTESLASTYPFISSEIYDSNGVLIGRNIQSRSLIVIDRFNSEVYKNANMCIVGTSGAGKSFLVKLMVLRNRYVGISQLVIDPDGEYFKVCNELEGAYIKVGSNSNSFVNIMDIRENNFEKEEGYLAEKILKLKIFFSLIFKNLTVQDETLIEKKIVECYARKGINFNDRSLYIENKSTVSVKMKFKSSKDMPVLEDLYKVFMEDKESQRFGELLEPYVFGSYRFFNNYTNVELNNKLTVADIHQLESENLAAGMFLITDIYWDRIRQNRGEKKIIYMDEIWRLIGNTSNLYTAEFVYKIFKTIRKFGGGATAITQDISDFFAFQDGKYGKAVINNSALKFILQLEEEDIRILSDVLNISEEEKIKIQTFERGTGLILAGRNHVVVKVDANREEYDLITTDFV